MQDEERWKEIWPHDDDDSGADVMSIAEFRASATAGHFVDDDGFGELATADGVPVFSKPNGYVSPITVMPSDVASPGWQPPYWATHVAWYNK